MEQIKGLLSQMSESNVLESYQRLSSGADMPLASPAHRLMLQPLHRCLPVSFFLVFSNGKPQPTNVGTDCFFSRCWEEVSEGSPGGYFNSICFSWNEVDISNLCFSYGERRSSHNNKSWLLLLGKKSYLEFREEKGQAKPRNSSLTVVGTVLMIYKRPKPRFLQLSDGSTKTALAYAVPDSSYPILTTHTFGRLVKPKAS
ncbi:hypothetical protein HPP92_004253 [Vanilla planifolia]|uniref:Uncharacterized protein n=1 Tax=Vanilla planifolia TaxID=51239 RepID=A0A835S9T8_VANPL|nr:hypothetical protein HPP92_004253 [Vanilla planifolia]